MKKCPIIQKIIVHRTMLGDFLEKTINTLVMAGPVPLLFVSPGIEMSNMRAYFLMAVLFNSLNSIFGSLYWHEAIPIDHGKLTSSSR